MCVCVWKGRGCTNSLSGYATAKNKIPSVQSAHKVSRILLGARARKTLYSIFVRTQQLVSDFFCHINLRSQLEGVQADRTGVRCGFLIHHHSFEVFRLSTEAGLLDECCTRIESCMAVSKMRTVESGVNSLSNISELIQKRSRYCYGVIHFEHHK